MGFTHKVVLHSVYKCKRFGLARLSVLLMCQAKHGATTFMKCHMEIPRITWISLNVLDNLQKVLGSLQEVKATHCSCLHSAWIKKMVDLERSWTSETQKVQESICIYSGCPTEVGKQLYLNCKFCGMVKPKILTRSPEKVAFFLWYTYYVLWFSIKFEISFQLYTTHLIEQFLNN